MLGWCQVDRHAGLTGERFRRTLEPKIPKHTDMETKKPLVISKIVIDRDLCIGAATCVTIAPGTFQMDEENKAILVDLHGDEAETILMSAESCPTKAIFLYDETGAQIYPYA